MLTRGLMPLYAKEVSPLEGRPPVQLFRREFLPQLTLADLIPSSGLCPGWNCRLG